ncbi:hypothetical protein NEMIN01_0447 [Nematocida minor]|uniref:uncharacterized protein n=1 Tax=Nematocida minor TaxID=1912983 RepID=UPI00221F6F61|nr:uncharacterized protein NEMIN01_0447 [Nematocida minor]KAI5189384.1 hypothetical protein NEMIN01_0447 [Nematocida minor]
MHCNKKRPFGAEKKEAEQKKSTSLKKTENSENRVLPSETEAVKEKSEKSEIAWPEKAYRGEAKQDPSRKWSKDQAMKYLENVLSNKSKQDLRNFQFYRIKGLPDKRVNPVILRTVWCSITGISSCNLGFITQIGGSEVQIAVPKKYEDNLELIVRSYEELNIKGVRIEGPVDPLEFNGISKEALLNILKDYALQLTKHSEMKNIDLYRFCEKVLACKTPDDFYMKVHFLK